MKHLSILFSVALLCGCQDKPTEPAPKIKAPASGAKASAGSGASAASAAPKAAASSNALLAAKSALAMVPKQADIVAMTGNAGALIKTLGREQVIKAIPQIYAQGATELRKEVGTDLLDPAQWKTIGVDAEGPGGLFVITRSLTIGFVVTLSDAKAFESWLKGRLAGQSGWKTLASDGGTVYLHKWAPTLVVKGEHFVLLGADRDALAAGWGAALAGMKPANSLAEDPRISAAAKSLGFGAHIGGFLDTQRTIDAIIGLEMRAANPDAVMLQGVLRGLGQVEMAERLDRFTRGRTDIGEQMAIGAIKGMIAGGVGPLTLGVEVEGAAVRLKADLEANATALPRRVLAPRKGASPLATLAGPAGIFMLDGNVDLVQLMAVVNTVLMTAGGAEMAKMEAGLRSELGLDLRTDIIPAFTGEMGGAMLHQDPKVKGEKGFGMTLFAGADPAKMQKVLDAIANHREGKQVISKVGARYQVKVPWRMVEAELKGDQLIVSTDAAAFGRSPGRTPAAHLGSTLSGLLSTSGTAATWTMELAPIFAFTMIAFSDWEMPMREIPNPDAATKEKLARRAELTAQIASLRDVERVAQLHAINEMVGPLGHLALTASETDAGLRFEGGLFTRGPYLKAISTFARAASTIDARMRELRKPVRALQDERRKIDNELREGRTPSMR